MPREVTRPYGCTVRPCECQWRERLKLRLPAAYQEAKLTDLAPMGLQTILEWFANRESPGLLLRGLPGRGKTHIAAGIVRALLEVGRDAWFVEMADFYRSIRNSFNADAGDESFVLTSWVDKPWLVLDDFGAGALTDFERRYAHELVNGRRTAQRKTILTTNLSLEEIREKMDERISSRLLEFQEVECKGKDRRAA